MLTIFHWWSMLRNFKMYGVIYPLQELWGYSLVNNNLLYSHMEEENLERDKRRMRSEWGLLEDKDHDFPILLLGDFIQTCVLDITHRICIKLGPVPLKKRKREFELYPWSKIQSLDLYSFIVRGSPSHHWSQQEGEHEYFRAKGERNQIQIEQDHTFQFASVSSLKLWLQLLNGDDWKRLSYQNDWVALSFSFSMSNQLAGVWTMLWKEEARYYTHIRMCVYPHNLLCN